MLSPFSLSRSLGRSWGLYCVVSLFYSVGVVTIYGGKTFNCLSVVLVYDDKEFTNNSVAVLAWDAVGSVYGDSVVVSVASVRSVYAGS